MNGELGTSLKCDVCSYASPSSRIFFIKILRSFTAVVMVVLMLEPDPFRWSFSLP